LIVASVHPGLEQKDRLDGLGVSQSAVAEHIGFLPNTTTKFAVRSLESAPRRRGNYRGRWALDQIFG
jgi:hypothetical protein